MHVSIVDLDALNFTKIKFYSVLVDGKSNSEFMDFLKRMKISNPNKLGELVIFINEIGEKYGAKTHLFRDERKAEALPPEYFQYLESDESDNNSPYGLRLYCMRVNESVVILFNGDLKTAQKVQDCKNCKPHFDRANKFALKIQEAILKRDIVPAHKIINQIDNFEFEI